MNAVRVLAADADGFSSTVHDEIDKGPSESDDDVLEFTAADANRHFSGPRTDATDSATPMTLAISLPDLDACIAHAPAIFDILPIRSPR